MKYRLSLLLGLMNLVIFTGGNSFAYYIPDTGITIKYSTSTGDDSDYQEAYNRMSFTLDTSSITQVVYDNVSGLTWISTAVYIGNWNNSISYCENLCVRDLCDFRLPNYKELVSIYDFSKVTTPRWNTDYFSGTANSYYTSSVFGSSPYVALVSVWGVYVDGVRGDSGTAYARCVRGPTEKYTQPIGVIDMNIVSISSGAIQLVEPSVTGIGIVSFLFGALVFVMFIFGLRTGKSL